jgi:hypothetical protein
MRAIRGRSCLALCVAATLSACAGQSSAPPMAPPSTAQRVGDAAKTTTTLPTTGVYVANGIGNSVSAFGFGVSGDVAPVRTIQGPNTKLQAPGDLAIDEHGIVFVLNDVNVKGKTPFVTVFAHDASGDVKPLNVFSTPAGIHLTVNRDGSLVYIASARAAGAAKNAINVYSSAGTLVRTLVSTNDVFSTCDTPIVCPPSAAFGTFAGLAIGPDDTLLVGFDQDFFFNATGPLYDEFSASASGASPPAKTVMLLSVNSSSFQSFDYAALTGNEVIFVNSQIGRPLIETYAGTGGQPIAEITAFNSTSNDQTDIASVVAIASSQHGDIFAVTSDNQLLFFRVGTTGNVPPTTIVTGPHTNLDGPTAVRVGQF